MAVGAISSCNNKIFERIICFVDLLQADGEFIAPEDSYRYGHYYAKGVETSGI